MTAPDPIPFDATAHWPDPDLSIARPSRPPAPAMREDDFSLIYGPWADWLRTAADVKGAPVDYVAIALLSVASAVIGNSRWAVPWDGWKEPPVLWCMLVGEPSAGKSPALDAVMDPVKEIERRLSEDYKARRKEWDATAEFAALALTQWKAEVRKAMADGEAPPSKPDSAETDAEPVRERISISDTTTEKVAELMAASWRGLLLSRDELSGWLGGMDRYNRGGDRPFWLEAYGGRSYTVDRKNCPEPAIVDHLSVAVLGGTQPDKLESLLVRAEDDGLLARFLTVFPDPVPLSRPSTRIDESKLQAALERLRTLSPGRDDSGNFRPLYLPFTDAAADALQEFRAQCRAWEAEASGMFKGHLGKLPGLAVRVSCVLAHLDWASEATALHPDRIEAAHVGRACHLVGEHLRQHAFRAYGAAALPQEIRSARNLARIVLKDRPRILTVRDFQRRELAGMQTAREVEAALRVLEDGDWLRREQQETRGRPRTLYLVNPKLGGAV